MINEKMVIEVIDQEKFIKRQIPITELIELLYEELVRKLYEPTERGKNVKNKSTN